MGLLFAAGAVTAQETAVEHCREAGSDAERIACLESALSRNATAPQAAPPERSAPETLPPETPAPEPSAPAPSPTVTSPTTSGGGTDGVVGIGAAQVRARNSTGDLESAHALRVASYNTVPFRRLQVELENGQVWRQIEGDTQRIRVDLERNQTVDIEESGLGGYKLRLNEIARTIRVERIR